VNQEPTNESAQQSEEGGKKGESKNKVRTKEQINLGGPKIPKSKGWGISVNPPHVRKGKDR